MNELREIRDAIEQSWVEMDKEQSFRELDNNKMILIVGGSGSSDDETTVKKQFTVVADVHRSMDWEPSRDYSSPDEDSFESYTNPCANSTILKHQSVITDDSNEIEVDSKREGKSECSLIVDDHSKVSR